MRVRLGWLWRARSVCAPLACACAARRVWLALALLGPLSAQAAQTERVTVYAAASLTDALQQLGRLYEATTGVQVKTSFAGSGTLARQIAAGAPADVFIAADQAWMNQLDASRQLKPGSRRNLLANSLVLIAPKGQEFAVRFTTEFSLPAAFTGRLCAGETRSVPAGIYARQALSHYRWWPGLARRVVGTDDVRTALAFVARGECALGVVYASDAQASAGVTVLGRFPAESHAPIRYPAALLTNAGPAASRFLEYLGGPQASAVFRQQGFETP